MIEEPMTLVTDYVLAILSVVLGTRLARSENREHLSVRLWAGAFLATGLGAILGGTYHGFGSHLDDTTRLLSWKLTMLSIGLASFFMLAGSAASSFRRSRLPPVLILITLKLLLFAALVLRESSFKWVIYDYGIAMGGVLLLQAPAIHRGHTVRAVWFIAGVSVSALAAIVQQARLSPHEHFNHNDLYHVVQMVAVYLLFRGASLLRDMR